MFILLSSYNIIAGRGQKALGSRVRSSSYSLVRERQPSQVETNENPYTTYGVSFPIQSVVTGNARGGWTESAGAETPEPVVSGNEQLHSLTLEYRL